MYRSFLPSVYLNLELRSRLLKDNFVDTRAHSLERNLDLVSVLEPKLRRSAHAHSLGSNFMSALNILIL